MAIVLSLLCKHTGWKIPAANWKIILLHLYAMGVISSPTVYISHLYCWRPEEQVKLDVFFWGQLASSRQKACSKRCWQVKRLPRDRPRRHNHLSTAFIPSNSGPFVAQRSESFTWHTLFFCLSLSFFFFTLCCFTILLWSGSDTLLVNQHRPYHLNEEVGWVQRMEPEQWLPLCVLFVFFFFSLLENSLKLSVTVDNDPIKTISHSYTLLFAGKYVFFCRASSPDSIPV